MKDLRDKLQDYTRMNYLLWGRPRSGLISFTSADIIDEVEERLEHLIEYRIEHIHYQIKSMVKTDLTKNKGR